MDPTVAFQKIAISIDIVVNRKIDMAPTKWLINMSAVRQSFTALQNNPQPSQSPQRTINPQK